MLDRPAGAPLRVLFLCAGNSARSQMAEAALNRRGRGRLVAESAGSHPAAEVHPLTIDILQASGLAWDDTRRPRGLSEVAAQRWDLVITLCDSARELCPVFPNRPATAHWGMPDPTIAQGTIAERRRAFSDAFSLVNRRVDLLLALPLEKLEALALSEQAHEIAETTAEASAVKPSAGEAR